MVDDLEENEEDGGERGGVDQPGGEMRRIGRRHLLREEKREIRSEKEEVRRTATELIRPQVCATGSGLSLIHI